MPIPCIYVSYNVTTLRGSGRECKISTTVKDVTLLAGVELDFALAYGLRAGSVVVLGYDAALNLDSVHVGRNLGELRMWSPTSNRGLAMEIVGERMDHRNSITETLISMARELLGEHFEIPKVVEM